MEPDYDYVSEFEDFMNHYLHDHPEVVADQRRGRAIYWDRPVDLEALEEAREDTVPTAGYYYFDLPADHGASGIPTEPSTSGEARH